MMKRLAFLYFFIFTLCLSLHAQVGEKRSDFAIGGNAGMLMTKMDMNPTIKQSYRYTPTFGFSARYICEKYFTAICGVSMEVNFASLGWKEVIEDGSGNTYSRSLTYVQVPVMMQMGWGREQRGCKFIFEAGPLLGYNLGSSESYGGRVWDVSKRPNNVVGQYGMTVDHKVDYGITAGIGMELSTPMGHFLINARYNYGLGDVFDNSKKGYFSRSAHQTITAKLTYFIDLVKTK
ncbi:MAG: PorT family protein [Bacteroidaceae bacterium]|nr:PorT family protein [Bacteroidaceae bacterium]